MLRPETPLSLGLLQITWDIACTFGGTKVPGKRSLIFNENPKACSLQVTRRCHRNGYRTQDAGSANNALEDLLRSCAIWVLIEWGSGRLNEYQVIGRHLPTDTNATPKLYRMRIFAPNTVVAKSRFWYFLMKLRKVKKSNGEIITINLIHERRPTKVKNFGIWIRYDSRSGTHNMYKEYREMSRTEAVDALYQDMAARHRARFRSIHILKVVELEKTDDVKRPYIKQLLSKNLKFPLPHRVPKATSKALFAAHRPATFA